MEVTKSDLEKVLVKSEIVVVCPFYNPGQFLDPCVGSIVTQSYDNYRMIFINDASTDNSKDKLPSYDTRATIINNPERRTALENIHDAVMSITNPEAIVALIDGDDFLPNRKVLEEVNQIYQDNDCWLHYGSCRWTDMRNGFESAYLKEEFENIRDIRKVPYRISHLRTFKAGLYHKIKEQDPTFSCLKDKNGKFYRTGYDTAMFYPMLELAGFDKVKYNKSILYIYNRHNPISDDKVDQAGQTNVHLEVLKKSPFKKIYSIL